MENTAIQNEEAKAINAEQLKKLQNFNVFMEKARLSLGELSIQYEFQKADILSQIAVQQQSFNELEKAIKEEYGNVRVNIETGEIVKQEEK
jgi:lipopolysaccharide biosynthesis regulator YciM